MACFERLPGVPSTLNKIVKSPDGAAILQPYPSSSANLLPLIYVQSMEVDPTGVMWILEVGRVRYDDGSGVISREVAEGRRVHTMSYTSRPTTIVVCRFYRFTAKC